MANLASDATTRVTFDSKVPGTSFSSTSERRRTSMSATESPFSPMDETNSDGTNMSSARMSVTAPSCGARASTTVTATGTSARAVSRRVAVTTMSEISAGRDGPATAAAAAAMSRITYSPKRQGACPG